MRRLTSIILMVVLLTLPAAVVGCSASTSSERAVPAAEASGTPSDALVNLDSTGHGTLSGVDLTLAGPSVAFDPEQRAIRRRWTLVNVGIRDHAKGVRTVLVVPMWFDERTKYVESPWLKGVDTLSEATKHSDFAWSEAGTTDIKFHLTDEVFYVDEVNMHFGDAAADDSVR
jgi:hypothetical protein